MHPPLATFTNTKQEAGYKYITDITVEGVSSSISIDYEDVSRYKSKFPDLRVNEVYITALKSPLTKVEQVTNLFLFIERHKQWILEQITL